MRKIIVVAVREYQASVKTKAFIVSVILMPILMGGAGVMQALLKDRVDTTDKKFAVLDQSGAIYDAIEKAANDYNESSDVFRGEGEDRTKVRPRYLVEKATVVATDPKKYVLELSDRVRKKEIFGFVMIGADVVQPGDDPVSAGVAYHSNSPTYDDFENWVSGQINARVRALRLEAAKLDAELVDAATRYVGISNLGLVSLDEEGRITRAAATNKLANVFVPMGMMMLMFMVVLVAASPLMQSVLEEKMQRIAEVLLGSVSPFQLMMGKLLGIVGVSLTMGVIYLAGGAFAIHRAGFGHFFPAHVVWWFVVYQTMAVLLYGSLFCAIGAAVSDMKEAQSMMTPVMLLVMGPMFVWLPIVKEPLSSMATWLSLFPPFTPMLMVLRQSVPPGVPLWQPLLGIVGVTLTVIVTVFIASRIFRVGLLMQGKGANFAELLRWAFRG